MAAMTAIELLFLKYMMWICIANTLCEWPREGYGYCIMIIADKQIICSQMHPSFDERHRCKMGKRVDAHGQKRRIDFR